MGEERDRGRDTQRDRDAQTDRQTQTGRQIGRDARLFLIVNVAHTLTQWLGRIKRERKEKERQHLDDIITTLICV